MSSAGTIYIADRRIYVDAAGHVVDERDPRKAMLLVPAGGQLSMDYARQLGLVPPLAPAPEPAPDETDTETAAKAAPPARNKARRPAANKGA